MEFTLQAKEKNIKKIYLLLYNIIFVGGIPLLALVVSILILFVLQKNTNIPSTSINVSSRTENVKKQEQQYLNQMNSFFGKTLTGQNKTTEVEVYLKNDTLNFSGTTIKSINNLLTYKGLVLPKITNINKKTRIKEKKYFSQPDYNIQQLEKYMTTVILQPFKSVKNKESTKKQLSLAANTLLVYFGLDCIKISDVNNQICRHYIQEFIRVLPIYDISKNYRDFQKVFDAVKKNKAIKEIFCAQTDKYIKYSNDTNSLLNFIISSCGSPYDQNYETIKSFFIAQQDLESETPSLTTYTNPLVNAYKVVSLQQIIFNEVYRKRLNHTKVSLYLQFVEELLKKDVLDHVYKDLIFYFNNSYLPTIFTSPAFNNTQSNKEQIKMLESHIRKINQGSSLKGYLGLSEQIFNKKLAYLTEDKEKEGTNKKALTLLERFDAQFSFINYRVKYIAQTGDNILITSGNLLIYDDDNKKAKKYKIRTTFHYYVGTFIVDEVSISGFNELNGILTTILDKNKLSFPELYNHIKSNIKVFEKKAENISLCDVFNENIKNIEQCGPEQLDVSVQSGDQKILYSFLYSSGNLKQIYITDKELEAKVLNRFSGFNTNEFTIEEYIATVLAYTPEIIEPEVPDETTQAMRLTIDADLKKFLGIPTDAILTKDDKTLLVFTIQNIAFIGDYDIDTKTLTNLFFKELGPGETFEEINFTLNENNIDELELFADDPLLFLEAMNPRIVALYKKTK